MSADLTAAAAVIDAFAATITEWPDDELGGHALAYAHNGWAVHPLHPWDCCCRGEFGCLTNPKQRGKRPHTIHGVDDATTDLNMVAGWWEHWPTANIGLRVPAGVVVLDIDPQNGGHDTWRHLHAEHAEVATRTAVSGRGNGGRHLYYARPAGELRGKLGEGVDVKKSGGYVVAPPSIHAETGNPYRWVDVVAPISPFPVHLLDAIRKPSRQGTRTTMRAYIGDSIADWYTTTHTWPEILEPYGWRVVIGDGDSDGSAWRRPGGEHPVNATVRHGLLFVYSNQTEFDVTEGSDPHGYTRFRAWAVLNHHGDLSAAARAAAAIRGAT